MFRVELTATCPPVRVSNWPAINGLLFVKLMVPVEPALNMEGPVVVVVMVVPPN
jgi:hypothetical protein